MVETAGFEPSDLLIMSQMLLTKLSYVSKTVDQIQRRINCTANWHRTSNLVFMKDLLHQLSYSGINCTRKIKKTTGVLLRQSVILTPPHPFRITLLGSCQLNGEILQVRSLTVNPLFQGWLLLSPPSDCFIFEVIPSLSL